MKQNAKLVVSCLRLELEIRKLKSKLNKVIKERDEYKANNDFLHIENATLKQINRKRYLQYEDKMHFLIKRENKLALIEQMEQNKEDFRKIRKVIKG